MEPLTLAGKPFNSGRQNRYSHSKSQANLHSESRVIFAYNAGSRVKDTLDSHYNSHLCNKIIT